MFFLIDFLLKLEVYEKGIGLFRWPLVFDVWNIYLTKFINRYVSKFLCVILISNIFATI
jgi:hypothetical protein